MPASQEPRTVTLASCDVLQELSAFTLVNVSTLPSGQRISISPACVRLAEPEEQPRILLRQVAAHGVHVVDHASCPFAVTVTRAPIAVREPVGNFSCGSMASQLFVLPPSLRSSFA